MRSFRLHSAPQAPTAAILALALVLLALPGCSVLLPVAGVVTAPMDKKGTFREIQAKYTSNIRYGLYDEALVYVEPADQQAFKAKRAAYDEIRFIDYVIERVEMNPAKTEATALVRYTGYWLASPFEQEIEVVQRWRRTPPSQRWFVTPELDALVTPTAGG